MAAQDAILRCQAALLDSILMSSDLSSDVALDAVADPDRNRMRGLG